jgi:hypothetical protein
MNAIGIGSTQAHAFAASAIWRDFAGVLLRALGAALAISIGLGVCVLALAAAATT